MSRRGAKEETLAEGHLFKVVRVDIGDHPVEHYVAGPDGRPFYLTSTEGLEGLHKVAELLVTCIESAQKQED